LIKLDPKTTKYKMLDQQQLLKAIMAIQADTSLTAEQKARKRQDLMSGKFLPNDKEAEEAVTSPGGTRRSKVASTSGADNNADGRSDKKKTVQYAQVAEEEEEDDDVLESLKCSICFDLCRQPVSLPCQHNMCLKCFNDMNARSRKHACPSCRSVFGRKIAENPRINTALTFAIRAIRAGKARALVAPAQAAQMLRNEDRPDEAYTTERAQRTGRANAASGRIMVTVPSDAFGPIGPEHDPIRNTGVLVGEYWKDRLDCRQWGAHFPHVAGIAGQSSRGAQSVVLSGGYTDDFDAGDWFLYTGSGGRDLSGNKRTNKVQSFDQTFDNMNQALKVSCEKGLPVRVVRSHKEKRSAFAPTEEVAVRYDGVYRIAKCWRKTGEQGPLVCRYLFVRCDNAPAPWDETEDGDAPWTLESLETSPPKGEWHKVEEEISQAKGKVYQMTDKPFWDFVEVDGKSMWGWAKPPPPSQKTGISKSTVAKKRVTEAERALREMTCSLCKQVMTQPVTTPCDHSFCRPCLESKFGDQGFEVDPKEKSHGRSLRVRTTIMECPARLCNYNIASFLRTCQVNRDMESVITSLQQQVAAAKEKEAREALENDGEGGSEEGGSGDGTSTTVVPTADQEMSDSGEKEVKKEEINTSSTLPEAWKRTMNLEKQREQDRVKQLYIDFKEFEADLIQALLEQEEGDDKSVRVALQRMQDDMRKFNQQQPKEPDSKNTPGKTRMKTSSESHPGKTLRKTPRKASTPTSTIDLCSPSDSTRSVRKKRRVSVG
jgi:E3 ubiquitin-protein ligase UHRF1